MLKFLISLLLISYLFCYYRPCQININDNTCRLGEDEALINGFSCHRFDDGYYISCQLYPDNPEIQKTALKIQNGMTKEVYSGISDLEDEIDFSNIKLFTTEEEKYSKEEEIVLQKADLTSEDKRIILSRKTCAYQYYGRFVEIIPKIIDFKDWNGYPNIKDKNECFNAEQFPDLKDLIDCGYAEIKYKLYSDVELKINTCFYIPNNNLQSNSELILNDNLPMISF